jgi:hypothetical protein
MNQMNFAHDELTARFGEEATLGQVFGQIEKDLKTVNEVVCRFTVNGLALDEDGEKRVAQSTLKEVQTLEVQSDRPAAILDNVLNSWTQQIPFLIKLNDDLASEIRFKGVEGQLKTLVDLIDESQLLVDSIISIDTVFSHLPLVRSESWRQAQKHMAHGIGEALQAFQKKDFNWLADILEYDMGHSLQTWMELLESLKQDVKNAAGRTP